MPGRTYHAAAIRIIANELTIVTIPVIPKLIPVIWMTTHHCNHSKITVIVSQDLLRLYYDKASGRENPLRLHLNR